MELVSLIMERIEQMKNEVYYEIQDAQDNQQICFPSTYITMDVLIDIEKEIMKIIKQYKNQQKKEVD